VKQEELDKLKELSEASKPKTRRMREYTYHVRDRAVTATLGPDDKREDFDGVHEIVYSDGRRTTVNTRLVHCIEYREFDVTLPEEKKRD
jgi:hypothetical protein